MKRIASGCLAAWLLAGAVWAAAPPPHRAQTRGALGTPAPQKLRVNPRLDYNSDSDDGELFLFPKGLKLDEGKLFPDRPHLILFYQVG